MDAIELSLPQLESILNGTEVYCDICLIYGFYVYGTHGFMADHYEAEHHMPIKREHESETECMVRFKQEYPAASTSDCKCPKCRAVKYRMID